MGNTSHYKTISFHDGILTVQLSSWKWFADYIQKKLIDYKSYVFRGQRQASWLLSSTLNRAIIDAGLNPTSFSYGAYLQHFKEATRGRRGSTPRELSENEWWALGQHHGLSTPLLDWTESPFVALYFAFVKPEKQLGGNRAVWVVSRNAVEKKSRSIAVRNNTVTTTPPCVEMVSPLTDDNARLVSQRGLFSHGPNGVSLCEWIKTHFKGEPKRCILIKIEIPEQKNTRVECLQFLNRMNINHLTLFPDLYGASKYCTMALEIKNY